jgi:hypothetical protein
MVDWANLYAAPQSDSDYRDIAVVVGATDAGRRVVGKARELADTLGCYVKVYGPATDWGPIGADRVFSGGSIDQFLDQEKPELVLFAPEKVLLEPILRYAQRRGLPVVGPCMDVYMDLATREAVAHRAILAGAMIADIITDKRPQIYALEPARLADPISNPSRSATITTLE